jgi:hypothetical protein
METELVLRGYPSRKRFAEWQQANSLPEDQLPKLSEEQRARARQLCIPERAYAVALKAAQLAGDRALEKMKRVANVIARAVKDRDPEAELTSVVWNFYEARFEFLVRYKIGKDSPKELEHFIPTQMIDDILLDKEGAERELMQAVSSQVSVLVE